MDVIGVGDADIDIYLEVDHVPGRDEKVLAKSLQLHPGGMVANFLVALARLGTSCAFHGPVGDDEFGRMTLDDLAANGVDVRAAVVKPGERTYFCVVMLDSSGEKSLVIAPTSAIVPLPSDLSEGAIANARHLHTTAANLETATSAVDLAKKHGLSVSLDLEPTAAQRGMDLQALLAQVDVLFVNQRAVNLLTGVTAVEEAAMEIIKLGPSIVCVTMGEAGSLTIGGSEILGTAAFPVEVVDSTGAGDCFAAAFVHGFLKGWSLRGTALFASAVGALSVTSYGGHTGAPTYDDVVAFLGARGSAGEHLL